ncbi:carbohydrate ABC transporter permease [Poriferisphaera sp. WC338]|uniref:carbohydrate ABC transporter permease n=1 Tax=Poriferisphaera sp. WC338 TaxID=3425129 RepID=UPI003D814DB4
MLDKINKILFNLILLLGALAFMVPLLWMISTALKPIDQTMSFPPTWIPTQGYAEIQGVEQPVRVVEQKDNTFIVSPENADATYTIPKESLKNKVEPRWENFGLAVKEMKYFWWYLRNTIVLCVLTVIGAVISNAFVAYGFSRIEWKGRDKLFALCLATMMIPGPVIMVPLYVMFKNFGWIGSLKPLWVPSFFAGAFNVFLLRQFFRTVPKELSESARIDGCSEFRIFWQIILPLAKPALMVVALFQFLGTWNDFLHPLIYLTDQKDFTLALGLQFYQSRAGGTQWHYLMAASTLVVLPVILLFFITQRKLIEGISMTGLKG